jgi:type IV pilus assembly protein PilE
MRPVEETTFVPTPAPSPGKRGRASGFTLIEAMVVVAVAGIIATIAVPGYREVVVRTRRAEGRAALLQAMLEQERRFTQTGTYETFSADQPKSFKWYSGAHPAASAYSLSAVACKNQPVSVCIKLLAQPGGNKVATGHVDPACGDLTLDSTGAQGAGGNGANCW